MELIDLVGSVIKTLVRWLTFLLGSQTVVHIVLFFWMYLFLLMPVFCCAMPLCQLGNSDHVLVSVFIDFIWNTHQNASFYTKLMTVAILIGMLWDSLHDHLRDVPWEDIIKLSASTAIVTYIVTRSQYVPFVTIYLIVTCWYRSLLVTASKFGLLTIRQNCATRKHLFLYSQGHRSGLRKPKKDKQQQLWQLPPLFISLS